MTEVAEPGNRCVLEFKHKLRQKLGLSSQPPFQYCGKTYDGNKWKKVPDPSDMPPPDWQPPGGNWDNWSQDQKLVPR